MTSMHETEVEVAARSVVLTRLFDAPRDLVFEVWTDHKHLDQWWGPTGFRNTTHEFAFESGGIWRFIMHGPDGTDYPNRIHFETIRRPELITFRHGGAESDPLEFQVEVKFEVEGDKTRVTQRMLFPTAEQLDFVIREHGAIEGGKQHLSRLADYLKEFVGSTPPKLS